MIGGLKLPFTVPVHSELYQIGCTPLASIEKGISAKLEGLNPSGSIKDRSVCYSVLKMFERGDLKSGSTVVLVTSGSAGVSLAFLRRVLAEDCGIDLKVVIVMPVEYRDKKAPLRCARQKHVTVVDDEMDPTLSCQLLFLKGSFLDVLKQGKALASQKGFAVLDQHYNEDGMLSHQHTARELLAQMPNVTDVVCTTGTGATAAGLRRFLPSYVNVHSRPALSGTIDGLTDVRRYSNFCDPLSLVGYTGSDFLDPVIAVEGQKRLLHQHKIDCGPSSGAALALAQQIKAERPEAEIVYISACGRPVATY